MNLFNLSFLTNELKNYSKVDEPLVEYAKKKLPVLQAYSQIMKLLNSNNQQSLINTRDALVSILKQVPLLADARFQLARISFEIEQKEDALKYIETALLISPKSINYHILSVALFADNGQFNKALSNIQKCISLFTDIDKQRVENIVTLPIELAIQGFLDFSLPRVFTHFVFTNGKLTLRKNLVHQFLEELLVPENAEKAAARVQAFLKDHPEFNELRFYLAKYLIEQQKTEEALSILNEGTNLDPTDWPSQILSGILQAENEDYKKAFTHFELAALTNEELPLPPLDTLTLDGRKQIIQWYNKLIESLPPYVGAYNNGWVYPPAPVQSLLVSRRDNEGATLANAWRDLYESFNRRRGWIALAKNDVISRYRRTVLGPWWIVLGTGMALGGMAIVWSTLFGMTMSEFFPYITAGYVTWMFISSVIIEGCYTFTDGQAIAIMRNMPMSKSMHAARLVARNAIIFVHTLAIFGVGALIYGVDVNMNTLLFIPGILILILVAFPVSLLFGVIGLRYRDFGPALGAMLTVLFLVTPILWKTEQLGERGYYAFFNPLTHFISIIRDPLLGKMPNIISYEISVGLTLTLWALALWIFSRSRNRLIFWI